MGDAHGATAITVGNKFGDSSLNFGRSLFVFNFTPIPLGKGMDPSLNVRPRQLWVNGCFF